MNLGEIRARVIGLIGEDSTSPLHFTAAELNRLINDSYRKIVRKTHALETVYQSAITAGVGEYTLPESVGNVLRVAFDKEKIFPTTVHELDRYQEDWETTNGAVQYYTLDQLDKNIIRLFRIPETSTGTSYDSELGTIIDINQTDLTEEFRFESDDVSLGTVVDYLQTGDTVTFAIAASGGGSDANYGIVVNMSSDGSDTYTLPSTELGTIVDAVEDSALDYDTETFIETRDGTANDNTQTTELGVVTDIDDPTGADSYFFTDSEGNNLEEFPFGAETGTVVDVSNSIFVPELGTMTSLLDTSDPTTIFSSETGIVVAMAEMELGVVVDIEGFSGRLEVWARKDPGDLEADSDAPDLPQHNHLAIAFEAAARALRKNSEINNPELAQAYQVLSDEQAKFLRSIVSNRTPERVKQMRQFRTTRALKRFARLPSTYPRIF